MSDIPASDSPVSDSPATDGSATDGPEEAACTASSHRMTRRHLWLLIVACAAVATVIAAMASLNTALPDIAIETGATQSQLTWIVDGYTLALAALLLPAGAIGDRFGRRGILIAGLVVFAAGSGMPLMLDGPTWVIVSRVIAGVGAALVMPATLSLITTGFPTEQRARAIGVWAGVAGSGAVVGMIVSGLILEYMSWKVVFAGFVVVSAVLVGMGLTIGSSKADDAAGFDIRGGVLSVAAVGLFVLGIMEGPHRGWVDPLTLGAIVSGSAAAAGFVFAELRAADPLLDVRLFRNRAFAVGAAGLALQYLAAFGVFFLIVQFFQLVLGYSPLTSAVALTPILVVVMALSMAVPLLLKWLSLRVLMGAGLALIGAGMFLLGLLGRETTYVQVSLVLLVMGAGIGICTAPATHAIVSNTPDDQQGVASAVNDATREIGAAIGIAVSGSVLAAAYAHRISPAAQMIPDESARAAVEDSLAMALQVAERAGEQGAPLVPLAQDAFLEGMRQASWAVAALMLVGAVVMAVWAPSTKG